MHSLGGPVQIGSACKYLLERKMMLTVYDSVFLRGVTWMRDSHGLFDYESRSINKKSLKTHTFGKIVRYNNDIDLYNIEKKMEEIGPDAQALLEIKMDASKFYFVCNLLHCRWLQFAPLLYL